MEEQGEFFSTNHKLLLNIAMWAKYLSWLILIFYVFRVWLYIPMYQMSIFGIQDLFNPSGIQQLFSYFSKNPYYLARFISAVLNMSITGVIIYLLLQSISLGLSMIVETNINYREQKAEGDKP